MAKKQPKKSLAAKLKERPVPSGKHLIVKAYAGTGKTFTGIVGVANAFAPKLWSMVIERLGNITPSDEQATIWEAFSWEQAQSITYCAFNKSIVTEFGEKWGWMQSLLSQAGVNLQFATVNALGNRACFKAYGKLQVTDKHCANVLAQIMGVSAWDLRRDHPVVSEATTKLCDLVKLTLAGYTPVFGFSPSNVTPEVLDELASWYDIELDGSRDKVYDLVPKVIERCMDVRGEIDFNDQNWIPVIHGLPIPQSDFLIVDEAQDLPRCKQEFVLRAGRRIGVFGDPHQAIYGFAGADTESMPRMATILGDTSRGVHGLKLTETRRCGKAIVIEAQKFVPDFRAHESNPEGKVSHAKMREYQKTLEDGNMCLCRINAPLISQAIACLRDGKKAIIRGRDFGGQLIKFIEKLKAKNIPELIQKCHAWTEQEVEKEEAKPHPSETRIAAIRDKADCIEAFSEGAETVQDIIQKIDTVFAGKKCPRCQRTYNEEVERCPNYDCKTETDPVTGYPCGPRLVTPQGILFSSVHRAKGLEAKRVFILLPKGASMPHPMAKTAWQKEQEMNLIYVSVTRSISELVFVTDSSSRKE